MFDRLRVEESLLITPGAHFGIGRYFRVGYGYDPEVLARGLARLGAWIDREKKGRGVEPAIEIALARLIAPRGADALCAQHRLSARRLSTFRQSRRTFCAA